VTAATTTSNAPVLKASGRKIKGAQAADLSWSGLSATSIDVYRNGAKVMTTPNDGFQTDSINKKGGGSYTYKACAAGTTTCSNTASVTF
jgi:thermitase